MRVSPLAAPGTTTRRARAPRLCLRNQCGVGVPVMPLGCFPVDAVSLILHLHNLPLRIALVGLREMRVAAISAGPGKHHRSFPSTHA
jgi:hypothetical protein